MGHMVIFRTTDGRPGYHQADSLEDAVRFVERLRNTEGVTDARIFRMQEVPIEFRTVWKVEILGVGEPVEARAEPDAAPGAEQESAADEPVAGASLASPVPAGGRFGLFGRS